MSLQDRKVVIVCFDEPVFYGGLYRRLIEDMPEKFCAVFVLPGVTGNGFKSTIREVLYSIRFFGICGFLYAVWRTVAARLTGSGDFVAAAKKADIPVHAAKSLGDAAAKIAGLAPDLVLASVPVRVREEALRTARIGWVNTHCGPLPRYAGQNSPFWVLLNNETETAVTIHYMDAAFDTGPIIAQQSVATSGHSYFSLAGALFDAAFEMHTRFLENGEPVPENARQQDAAERTYFGKPAIADGQAFRRQGKRFF